jgi:hypothetical protein
MFCDFPTSSAGAGAALGQSGAPAPFQHALPAFSHANIDEKTGRPLRMRPVLFKKMAGTAL